PASSTLPCTLTLHDALPICSRHRDEVFLEHLGRKHGGLIFEVRREQFSSGFPLLRIVSSLSADEDVRIGGGKCSILVPDCQGMASERSANGPVLLEDPVLPATVVNGRRRHERRRP